MVNESANKIKCVVWDLDNTLWNGTLLENDHITLNDNVKNIIKTLDQRGILQSIASRNDHDHAIKKVKALGLIDYFLYPEINWDSKSESIKRIKKSINIGMDTIAFIDDQPYEREEVKFNLPEVFTIDAANLDKVLDMPQMNPRFITDESKIRRQLYLSDIKRKKIEDEFKGPNENFLKSLDMKLSISYATQEDLKRAEELTIRTHQLNTTGYTYSYDELNHFRLSDNYLLFVVSLDDKFGTYGKIGLVLVEIQNKEIWVIKLLIMSCRVMSRGVGSIIINHIMGEAKKNKKRLQAELIETDRNRMMYMTYKFANFKERDKKNNLMIFENDLTRIQAVPSYIKLIS